MSGIVAGALNRKVDFYRAIKTTDHTGQAVVSYSLDFSAMAKVSPVRGSELARYGRVGAATQLLRFQIYYRTNLTTEHRIRYNGNDYNIDTFFAEGDMQRRYVTIIAEILELNQIVT